MEENRSIETLTGYRWWLRKKRSRYLCTFAGVTAAVVLMGLLARFAGLDGMDSSDIVGGIAILLAFEAVAVYQLILWCRTFRRRVVGAWTGVVREKHKTRYPNKRVKSYHITADVNGTLMTTVCLKQTYYRAEPGQQILLFTYGGSCIHSVHPEV